MPAYRKERLEEAIKRVVADSLLKEIKDPRIGFVTVTSVELSKDKSMASIYVSVLGSANTARKTMAGLESAGGYIKFMIGKSIKMRNTPKIRFFLDKSIGYESDMINLLDKLEGERSLTENPDTDQDMEEDGAE